MTYNSSDSSLSQFLEIWNRISEDRRNTNLNHAILAWCEELAIEETLNCDSAEIIQNINEWLNNRELVEKSFNIYKILLRCTNSRLVRRLKNSMLPPPLADLTPDFLDRTVKEWSQGYLDRIEKNEFRDNCKDSLYEMERNAMNNPALVGLVAFALVGMAIATILSKKKRPSRRNSASKKIHTPIQTTVSLPSSPSVSPAKTEAVLVLVINAQSEQLLNSLKQNKKLTVDDCESLGRATKYLWMGDKNEFSPDLKKWVDASPVPENEETEYDVYLVQINLNQYESGFEQTTSAIKRLDAFGRLPDIAGEVKVSHRLPAKAYENTSLYRSR